MFVWMSVYMCVRMNVGVCVCVRMCLCVCEDECGAGCKARIGRLQLPPVLPPPLNSAHLSLPGLRASPSPHQHMVAEPKHFPPKQTLKGSG